MATQDCKKCIQECNSTYLSNALNAAWRVLESSGRPLRRVLEELVFATCTAIDATGLAKLEDIGRSLGRCGDMQSKHAIERAASYLARSRKRRLTRRDAWPCESHTSEIFHDGSSSNKRDSEIVGLP